MPLTAQEAIQLLTSNPSAYATEAALQTKGVSFAFNFKQPCHVAHALN